MAYTSKFTGSIIDGAIQKMVDITYTASEINSAIKKVNSGEIVSEPDVLPFQLADFRGERDGTTITLSAEKIVSGTNTYCEQVVWVYNSTRVPQNRQDGTQIMLSKSEFTASATGQRVSKKITGIPTNSKFYARQFAANAKGQWQTEMSVADFNRRLEPVFGDNTPEQIGWAVDNNQVPATWTVGSEIDIMVGSEKLTFVIVGLNHDDLTAGGKANISLGMKQLMNTAKKLSNSDSNAGSFPATQMYSDLNTTIFNQLPEGWKNIIKPVLKKTTAGSKSTTIRTDSMKMWLFSLTEVYGSLPAEGTKYEYYNKNTSLVKRMANGAGTASNWWLRSPYTSGTNTFWYVTSSGSTDDYYPTAAYGVCFGFCV